MAKQTYKGSMKLSAIDKTAFYTNEQGEKYLQWVMSIDDDNPDQWGNVGSMRQDLGKDRRDDPAVWLGKAKPLMRRDNGQGGGQRTAAPVARPTSIVPVAEDDSEMPF